MNPRIRLAEVVERMQTIQAEVTDLDSLEAPSDDDAQRAESLTSEFKELEAQRAAELRRERERKQAEWDALTPDQKLQRINARRKAAA